MNTVVEAQKVPFSEHVRELRRRLFWSALAFLTGSFLGYAFRGALIAFLKRPLHGPLYYDSPAGNFNLVMQVCVLAGIFLALPVLLYQLVQFVRPAVERQLNKSHFGVLVVLSIVLAAAGILFAYSIALPMSLHFFAGFKLEGINPLISASTYMSFVLKCIATFMVIFQLPLLLLFVNFIRPFPPGVLLKYEKYVIVGSLAIALILPFTYDPLTQFVIAAPIVLLYNLSIGLIWLTNRSRSTVATIPNSQSLTANLRVLQAHQTSQPKPLQDIKPVHSPLATSVVATSSTPTASQSSVTAVIRSSPRLISDVVRIPHRSSHARLVLRSQ